MATAEFSKFAGILSAALSQHHLSGFEIAQLEFIISTSFVVILPKAHLTSHSRMSCSMYKFSTYKTEWERLEISSRKSEILKGTFHAKMGLIKDRNGMDLTEAEDIKKRWQEYTELYKKDLHNQDNHNGVITHLEPDILEWEVKWALGSITTNKASGGDGTPLSYFKS